MNPRHVQAQALLAEARALGVDVADLVAAAGPIDLPAVSGWITEIEPTFSAATARTYRSYWHLAARLVGDRRLAELTSVDLAAVVRAASERARATHSTGGRSRRRPASRPSEPSVPEPSAPVTSPATPPAPWASPAGPGRAAVPSTTGRSASLPTQFGSRAATPTSICSSSASTSKPARAARAPSTFARTTLISAGRRYGSTRSTAPGGSSPSRRR